MEFKVNNMNRPLRNVKCPRCKIEKATPEFLGSWLCNTCGFTHKIAETTIEDTMKMPEMERAINEMKARGIISGINIL